LMYFSVLWLIFGLQRVTNNKSNYPVFVV